MSENNSLWNDRNGFDFWIYCSSWGHVKQVPNPLFDVLLMLKSMLLFSKILLFSSQCYRFLCLIFGIQRLCRKLRTWMQQRTSTKWMFEEMKWVEWIVDFKMLPAPVVWFEWYASSSVQARILPTRVDHVLAGVALVARSAEAKETWKNSEV